MDIQKTKSKTRITKNTMPTTNSSTIQVQKRDGRLESLDINKIHFSIGKSSDGSAHLEKFFQCNGLLCPRNARDSLLFHRHEFYI